MNNYDMRIKCAVPPLCYDFSAPEIFLNDPANQKAIGATKKWESCNFAVNKMFQNDFMKNYHTKLPELLADGIRVMIYAGDVWGAKSFTRDPAGIPVGRWEIP